MRPGSLRARLVAGTAVWLLAGLALGAVALSLAFRRAVEEAFDERLDSLLVAVTGTLEAPPEGPVRVPQPIADPRFDRAYSGWYWQVNDGPDRIRSRSLWDAVLALDETPQPGGRRRRVLTGPRSERLRVRTRSLRYPSRAQPVTVAVAGPEGELRQEIRRFDRLLAISLGALGLGLALALAVQVGYGLRPLRRLAAELDAVRDGRVARLGADYPHEIRPLVQAMNDVLDHDAALIARARTHLGNLAHGLKTPLAVLAAETAPSGSDRDRRLAEQVAVMTRLVDHHLTRAAAAGTRRVLGARTDVAPVVHALRETLGRLHAGRGVTITAAVPAGAVFAGEREDLEELLGNVLDNACKWAASRVVLTFEDDGGRLHVVVDDDGPGLTAEEAARALERGARLDGDTPGSGLGLSIAAELAGLYGGSLALSRSGLGGLRVDLALPAGH